MTTAIRVDVHLEPDAAATALDADVRAGLGATPKTLPPKWFYDDRGSELFDEITRLPEYYPTRTERAILVAHAADIADAHRRRHAGGAGLGHQREDPPAPRRAHRGRHAPPVRPVRRERADVARRGRRGGAREYDGVAVHAVVGDFEQHLDRIPGPRPRAAPGWSRSSAARSATSRRRSAPASSPTSSPVSHRATRSCSAPTS